MRPAPALLVACSLLASRAAPAQGQAPALTLTLRSSVPEVRTVNLLADGKYTALMRAGLPLRLHYRLELWRVRSGWFDQFIRDVEWDAVARHDPLTDEFMLIRPDGRISRHATDEDIARALETAYRIPLTSTASGRFYFACRLQVTTLNESDLAELERWLRGEAGSAAAGERGVGEALVRGLQRVLVRIAGLPRLTLEARSPTFRQ
ncbi:MAG TPA: DUF4390 domain-containing protein [Gemmatimonadales bacterium]|nr:DUF4390 domain-containing protein [Gemmatimonadales bacterium]